jgi:hypothetical protein
VSEYKGACEEGERLWREWSDACDILALARDHRESVETAKKGEQKAREAVNGHCVNHNCMPLITGSLWAGGKQE